MSVVAVYNMKGGVGKTTTAVNLSYLAAAAGQRTLLWDLDPQAASSFAFRIQPRVVGFGRKSLESGGTLAAAIKGTDYDNLDLLPADFAYRKLDRLLDHLGKPSRVIATLFDRLARDYDAVFLDCPAGFSLLTEGVFAAADAVLVPTIPTVLSLRMVARIIKWADRADSPSDLGVFFNMVDRRKALHRRACDWSVGHSGVLLAGQIPYASIVEQMTVRRMPLSAFAARDLSAAAFAGIWAELQARLEQPEKGPPRQNRRERLLGAIESLIEWLEAGAVREPGSSLAPASPVSRPVAGSDFPSDAPGADEFDFVHSFDTDERDLQRCGYVLELRERSGSFRVVTARAGSDDRVDTAKWAQARIDRSWAMEILSGMISPLEVLGHRLGTPKPLLFENVTTVVSGRKLGRIGSRAAGPASALHSTNQYRPAAHGRSAGL
jgi:chromosome partitioning protein